MLQVNLKKLISKLAYEADAKALTVQYLADETGIHRNTITRLLDEPEVNCHTDMLNKLLKLFFDEFKAIRGGRTVDENALANELLQEFITVVPIKTTKKSKSKN